MMQKMIYSGVGTAMKAILLFFLLISINATPLKASSIQTPINLEDVLLVEPVPLDPFDLINHHGQLFDLNQIKGQWTYFFFGYTHCPDICPTELGILAELFSKFNASISKHEQPKGVFVAIDPERDTTKHLKHYVPYFFQDFLGVTGTTENISLFAHQLGAIYRIPPTADPKMGYAVSHSAAFHLVSPNGQLVAIFQTPHDPEILFAQFVEIRHKWLNNNLFSQ